MPAPDPRSVIPALLALGLVLIGSAFAAITPYRALVAIDTIGLDRATFAAATTAGAVVGALGSMGLGAWADRAQDRRPLALVCLFLGAVGYGLVWLFPAPVVLIVALAVFLPFSVASVSQSLSYARAWYDEHRPGQGPRAMSNLRATFSASWVVVPPLAGWVAARFTPLDLFLWAWGASLAAAGVFAWLLLRPEGRTTRPAKHPPGAGSAFPAHRRIGVAAIFLLRVPIFVQMMTQPMLLTHDIGAGLGQVGIVAAIAAALEVPFMLAWGRLIARLGMERILAIAGLIFAVYLALLSQATSLWSVYALQGVNALGLSALLSISISYMQDSIRGRVGLSTALMDAVTVTATLAASAVFGFLPTGGSYRPILLTGALSAALGAAVIWYSRRLAARAS